MKRQWSALIGQGLRWGFHPWALMLMALLALSPIFSKGETREPSKTAQQTKAVFPVLEYRFPEDRPETERTIAAEEIANAIRAGKAVDIDNAVIRGPFILRSVSVKGDISIKNTRITDRVDWSYANFKGKVALGGDTFEKEAVFQGDLFGKTVNLDHALFKQQASFIGAQIGQDASFQGARFEKQAMFFNIRIGNDANYDKAGFKDWVSFDGAWIEGVAFFKEVSFEGAAYFVGARIGKGAFFTGANFAGRVSFQDASFEKISFGPPEAKFQQTQPIDLRGSVYNRIDDPYLFWARLSSLKNLRLDWQFFRTLETTFREAGEEDLAKHVYYTRRLWEAHRISFEEQPVMWIRDRLLWLLTGYGVQLWRILIVITLILAFGTVIFHMRGAVEAKRDARLSPVVGQKADPDGRISLPWSDAFWISLRLFLPVEIPAAADWQPSSRTIGGVRCTSWASVLKVVGWILVPLGVAGLTGFLIR